MNKIITNNYIRITKKQAESLYKTRQDFYMCPCNLNPDNAWIILKCSPSLYEEYKGKTFTTLVNEFTYYNCNNQLGYYPAFYMNRKEYEQRTKREFI